MTQVLEISGKLPVIRTLQWEYQYLDSRLQSSTSFKRFSSGSWHAPCNLCYSYWKCISSVHHKWVQEKREECCFNEACVILITLTTHLQLYMKQHRMSRLSLQENGKVELKSAEGRKLAEWIADIHKIIAISTVVDTRSHKVAAQSRNSR